MEEAMIEWNQYQEVCKIIQQLQEDPSALDKFVRKNDLLWYHDHLYLYKNSQLKQKVLLELHTSPIRGHLGFLKTYHKIKKDFFWEGIKIDVQNFVLECVLCRQNKGETIKMSGLLQPLAIPSQRCKEVSMDFIVGLPKYEGNIVIMAVMDRLTKYAHFFLSFSSF
jgi:hypothetical protein